MFDMRDNALSYADFINWIVKKFGELIVTLLNFNYGSESVTTTAITSAATALTGLFLAMEYISFFSSMRLEGRIEDAIQLGIKLITAKIIVENSSLIIGGIYEMFKGVGIDSITEGFNKLSSGTINSLTADFVDNNKLFLGIGYVFTCIVMMIVAVIVVIMMMILVAQIVGIIFEIAVHQAVGPIAISTLCCGATRSAGISFIKSYTAVCLQTAVIGAIFKVFTLIYDKLSFSSADESSLMSMVAKTGVFGSMFNYITPILMIMVLTMSVKKSGEITKRMFGA